MFKTIIIDEIIIQVIMLHLLRLIILNKIKHKLLRRIILYFLAFYEVRFWITPRYNVFLSICYKSFYVYGRNYLLG